MLFCFFSEDDHTTSIIEFNVDKVETKRYLEATRRLLCLTQSCIVERDPETYHIVTLRPLESIFAIVRDPVNPRQFIIEYRDMESSNIRTYDGANRYSLFIFIEIKYTVISYWTMAYFLPLYVLFS